MQLHDLEAQIEEERKLRISASGNRKKLEAEIADLNAQLDVEIKAKEDALKYHKKNQVSTGLNYPSECCITLTFFIVVYY